MRPTAIVISMLFAALVAQTGPAKHSSAVMLDYSHRPKVSSPDGKWDVTVWGEKEETAWLMLESREGPRYRVQVWPITSEAYVLWAPDSKAFAFVDARWENHYFLYADLLKGYRGSTVVPLSDLIQKRFKKSVDARLEILRWYVKPLLWSHKGLLLVGVDCVTTKRVQPLLPYAPVEDHLVGYLVDVRRKQIVRDLTARQVLLHYKIDLKHETW